MTLPARRELGALLVPPRRAHPWPDRIPSSRFGQLPGTTSSWEVAAICSLQLTVAVTATGAGTSAAHWTVTFAGHAIVACVTWAVALAELVTWA